MSKVLHIDSSVLGEQSVSRRLADELVSKLKEKHQQVEVQRRDLVADAVPHIDGTWLTAISTDEAARTEEQQRKAAYSDTLIEEAENAEMIVIAAPMYNFSVPSVLKAWFDHLARAGKTFRYTDQGPEGLLKDKVAYVVTTRGGIHRDQPSDAQVPFIKSILSLIGIDDVHFIYAEGLNMGGDAREAGLRQAREAINDALAEER